MPLTMLILGITGSLFACLRVYISMYWSIFFSNQPLIFSISWTVSPTVKGSFNPDQHVLQARSAFPVLRSLGLCARHQIVNLYLGTFLPANLMGAMNAVIVKTLVHNIRKLCRAKI